LNPRTKKEKKELGSRTTVVSTAQKYSRLTNGYKSDEYRVGEIDKNAVLFFLSFFVFLWVLEN